jgi:hypothetical protein
MISDSLTMKGLTILHKILRAIIIFLPIFTLGWLTVKEIVPSGRVEATYDMRRETPFISKLYPKDRVGETVRGADGDYYRVFLDEPVYFDLKPSDKFEKVTVAVKYKNSGQASLKMGGLVNKNDWLFDWRDLVGERGKWQTQTEIFEFSKLLPEGQKYRFGFSALGLKQGEVKISEIDVIFERKPLTEKEVVNKILDAAVWRLNKLL